MPALRSRPMAHPRLFDEDDPCLHALRKLCLALPGTQERVSHGRPNWYTKTTFAYFGGTVKGDHDSERHAHALLFKPEPEERQALEHDARTFTPAYLGPSGWLGIDLDRGTDWAEVAELVESSFRQTAPARLVRELDER